MVWLRHDAGEGLGTYAEREEDEGAISKGTESGGCEPGLRKLNSHASRAQDDEITVEEVTIWFGKAESLALKRLPDPEFLKHKDDV